MIADPSQLGEVLRSLPKPKPGHIRVYRGQPTDHGSMLPSGLRGAPLSDEALFNFYTQYIAVVLRGRTNDGFHDFESYLIWVRGLAQHYGPGSRFLDVTHSLDVALWFALHAARSAGSFGLIGPTGPPDPLRGRVVELDYVAFEPTADEQGFLYVFDVPEWSGQGPLEHGALVDLEKAPPIFAESARIRAQAACLLYADRTTDGGDLSALINGDPLRIHRSAAGMAASLARAELFPGPQSDPWYNRFVSIPLVNSFDDTTRALALTQAIPVTLHLTDEASREAIGKRRVALEPCVLWSRLKSERANDPTKYPEGFDPARALPILLEFPLFAMTPPFESGQWNVGIAISGLPQTAQVRDSQTGDISREPLAKVFIEFSPLELVDWEKVEVSGSTTSFRRGAQVEVREDGFDLWLVDQQLPDGHTSVKGPIHFARDETGDLVYAPSDRETSQPLSTCPPTSKRLLVVLTILREFADNMLPCPFPMMTVNNAVYVVRGQGGGATNLLRVTVGQGDDQVHLLRDSGTGRPFRLSLSPGVIVAKTEGGYSSFVPSSPSSNKDDHSRNGV